MAVEVVSGTRMMTDAERSAYEQDGFLVVRDFVPHQLLNAIDQDMEVEYQRKSRDPTLSVEEVNNSHALGRDNAHAVAMSRDPRTLDLIQDLVQPGISLYSAKVISKAPDDRNMVCHWHQDEAYWHDVCPSRCRLSLWMPLQDVDSGNGCLRVVPGSHRHGVVPHLPRSSRDHGACRLSFADGRTELPGAVELPLAAGSMIIFSSRLKHSSLGNRTPRHRRAFILTYLENVTGGRMKDHFEVLRRPPDLTTVYAAADAAGRDGTATSP